MANPGKPAEVKKAIDSRHYVAESRLEFEEVVSVPEPERRLGSSGLSLWQRTWSLGKSWISSKTDVDLLIMTCEMMDERDLLRDYVLENMDAWRERAGVRELEKSIRSNLSLLGFTPTDRAKLGVAEIKTMTALEQFNEMTKPDGW